MDNYKGFTKLPNSLLEWGWFTDPHSLLVYIYLLIRANHQDLEYRGVYLRRGQVLTTLKELCDKLNLTAREVRTSLTRLKTTNKATIKTTNKYSVITLCEYDSYEDGNFANDKQNDKQSDKQTTNKRQTNDKQTTSLYNKKNKEDKESKEDKEYSLFADAHETTTEETAVVTLPQTATPVNRRQIPPTLQWVIAYFEEQGFCSGGLYWDRQDEIQRFFDYYTSNGWKVGKNPMKDWQAAIRNWIKNLKARTYGSSSPQTNASRGNTQTSDEWKRHADELALSIMEGCTINPEIRKLFPGIGDDVQPQPQ